MKKNIMIINADREAAKIVKDNLACPSTNILCVSSIHEALLSFVDKEFCLVILDACISAEDDHKLLKATRKARTTPILILSSQSCHVERLKVLQAGAHAYIGHPYSLEECLAQAQSLMQLYCDLKPQKEVCYTLAFGKDLIIDPLTRQVILRTCNSPVRSLTCCSASQVIPDRYSAVSSSTTKYGMNIPHTMWMMW